MMHVQVVRTDTGEIEITFDADGTSGTVGLEPRLARDLAVTILEKTRGFEDAADSEEDAPDR